MSLLTRHAGRRRHIGRRVAGVGVAAALLLLGLEAPAFAVTPTITSFAPGSGPPGCVVVITGTNFNNPNVSAVDFGGINAPDFSIISATELWATVPPAAVDGAIHVTNASGTGNSPSNFDVTAAGTPGGCAPTITSFTPTCGLAGATITITGTNLLKSADPATTTSAVLFADYNPALRLAAHTVPNSETPTTLSVLVPSGTTDGPIRVETFDSTIGSGAALSTTIFAAPPPDCVPVTGNEHARSITLTLKKHLVARGVVSSTEDPAFTDCVAGVTVKIQRRAKGGGWKNVGSATTTDTGSYKKKVKDKPGKYRARATQVSLGDPVTDVCLQATSARRTHKH